MVDIGVTPGSNLKSAGWYGFTMVKNLSKIGHSSMPNGLSIDGRWMSLTRVVTKSVILNVY